MTFNTQHCLNYKEQVIDYNIMADAVLGCGADIVGLNEMRSDDVNMPYDRQTEILSSLTGLTHNYFAKAINVERDNPPYAYGNGFISKFPIVGAETILIPDAVPKRGETRCILKAQLENGFTVLVTHFGLNPEEQKNAVDTVIKHIEKDKCILMGDFNVTPDDDVLKPIRELMQDTAEKFLASYNSFPSDKPDRKIDYIFVSRDVDVVRADIPAIVASDHRPHTAEINI